MSFTIRYNETRLADPDVSLVGGVPEGATLTVGKAEPGVIRILIDTVSAFDSKEIGALVDVTFKVLADAPSGDTFVEIEDLVFSDAEARATGSKATSGTISIAGANPVQTDKGAKARDKQRRANRNTILSLGFIEEWLNESFVILKPRTND